MKEKVENMSAANASSSPRISINTTPYGSPSKSWFEMVEGDDDVELYSDEHFQRITTPDVLQPLSSPTTINGISPPTSDDEEDEAAIPGTDGDATLEDDSSRPHMLRSRWTIFYDQGFKTGTNPEDYEKSINQIGSFDSIEDFWRYWNNINLPYYKMPSYLNLRLFKEGIKPLYEDPKNIDGGRWVIQTHKKESRQATWNEIVLAVIGEKHFSDKYEVNGVVLSSRKTYDAIQIWNGCMLDRKHIQYIMKKIRSILQSIDTDDTTTIEYQANRGVKKYNEKETIRKSVLQALRNQVRFTSFSPPSSPSLNSPSFPPIMTSTSKHLSPLSNPANMYTAADFLPPLSLEELESELLKSSDSKNDDIDPPAAASTLSSTTNTVQKSNDLKDNSDSLPSKRNDQGSSSSSQITPNTLFSAGHSIGRASGGFVVGRGFHLNSSRSRLQNNNSHKSSIVKADTIEDTPQHMDEEKVSTPPSQPTSDKLKDSTHEENYCSTSSHSDEEESDGDTDVSTTSSTNNAQQESDEETSTTEEMQTKPSSVIKGSIKHNGEVLKLISLFVMAVIWQIINTTK
nr:unnamed protein product [Naegleria fowleri]